ncbi:hypothetical protein Tery_3518 [Trichodesmium erythraeum IMS101]|uniref:Uncharacterized protein n=1 Tax=Trichodesmium erythraeum (strain IMS101) TaxID=203124 RepID=Q10YR6_TRIEI|nr:hypothetical protein [Trichodesmium erythraeum 21-75]
MVSIGHLAIAFGSPSMLDYKAFQNDLIYYQQNIVETLHQTYLLQKEIGIKTMNKNPTIETIYKVCLCITEPFLVNNSILATIW